MTEHDFWRYISTIDRGALRVGDEEGAVRPLQTALERLPAKELEDFEDLLTRKLYDLDGEEFAKNAGESGRSDDGFLYARCYVVASGREHYEAVRSDPREMPKSIEQWCEPLLSAHVRAWVESTGRDESEWDHVPSVSYESCSNKGLWPSRA
jgi:uncharacterized protein DUF4240